MTISIVKALRSPVVKKIHVNLFNSASSKGVILLCTTFWGTSFTINTIMEKGQERML